MRAGVKVQIWQAPTLAADSGSLELLCCLHQDRRQARPNSQLEARDWGGPTTSSMRPKKSYCWLTVWSCSFIGLSGPRQTSRQKHHLKTRNWANPSDDWICGISQIKTEQERNCCINWMLTASVLTSTGWKGDPRKREIKRWKQREKRKMLQTNIPNKRRLMINKIMNKIEKQNRSELNGIVRKRPKWECLECLRRYIRTFYSLKRKRLWNKGSQS